MIQCHYCEETRPPLYIVHELRRSKPLPEPLHVCQACRYDPELEGNFISRHSFHEHYPHLVRTPAHQGQTKHKETRPKPVERPQVETRSEQRQTLERHQTSEHHHSSERHQAPERSWQDSRQVPEHAPQECWQQPEQLVKGYWETGPLAPQDSRQRALKKGRKG